MSTETDILIPWVPGSALTARPAVDRCMREAVCETLNIAPRVAETVVLRAERRGKPLPPPTRGRYASSWDLYWRLECERAWNDWVAATARGGRVH